MFRQFIGCMSIFILLLIRIGITQSDIEMQLKTLIEKEKLYDTLEDSVTVIENKEQIANIESKKAKLYRAILSIKSEIFDAEHAEAIWVEGEGEIILDDKKPFEQNKRLVEMFARRDAMEKGGKILIETLTQLKRFEVDAEEGSNIESKYVEEFQSIIESKGKVKVVDQDLTGDFAKIITLQEDGVKKLKTKVRLKITSIDEINPFKQELENLK